jgi:hypothetical protein
VVGPLPCRERGVGCRLPLRIDGLSLDAVTLDHRGGHCSQPLRRRHRMAGHMRRNGKPGSDADTNRDTVRLGYLTSR